MSYGTCPKCGMEHMPLERLHGENGGPLFCAVCASYWRAEQTRRRRAGRIVIKAMELYEREGGNWADFDKMKLCVGPGFRDWGRELVGYDLDALGSDVGDITTELLDDTVKLTHPDRHPPERRALAQRVTSQLLALRPFTFPAPKPKPPPAPRDGSAASPTGNILKPSRSTYPCDTCADTIPYYYCNGCRAEWEKRQREERERETVKRRQQYARRRERRLRHIPPAICPVCDREVPTRRKGAKFCSPACRQRAYRRRNGSVAGRGRRAARGGAGETRALTTI